jgi:hypothetical protein
MDNRDEEEPEEGDLGSFPPVVEAWLPSLHSVPTQASGAGARGGESSLPAFVPLI